MKNDSLIIPILLFCCFSVFADAPEDALTSLVVAAVQMEVDVQTYTSGQTFFAALEKPLADAAAAGAELVIFPEYLGVFYPFTEYSGLIGEARGIMEVLQRLSAGAGRRVTPFELFLKGGPAVEEALLGWSSLARRYGVTLVAGSFFVPHPRGDGTTELRNRSYVFSPAGQMIYSQDKVFLTEYEEQIVGLSPGKMAAARGFELKDRRVVMTLCRDTYFTPWEEKYRGEADLWIDIKANGEVFDRSQQESFARALPARLENSGVPRGVTVCLVGSFLELFWQGRSSFVENQAGRIVTAQASSSPENYELLIRRISWD